MEQVPDTRVQLGVTFPTVVFEDVNVTIPEGVFDEAMVSETVAVQVDVPSILTLLGLQETRVEVSCRGGAVTDMSKKAVLVK